jgi:glycosyltransferase involved in cell wall biosynthesis
VRIGVDGYNLALPHGTGVATYAAALASTLQSMGHHVTGVFGLNVDGSTAQREVLFFDGLQRPQPVRHRKSIGAWIVDGTRILTGPRLQDVPLTDLVEKGVYRDRFPKFDRLVSMRDLFALAHLVFRKTDRFLTVTMADPPEIMHWTYPVPIRLRGARNVYTLHDLVPLKLPYATLDAKRRYFSLIEQCLRSADQICTVSEASRCDVIEHFGFAAARITNTYQTAPLPAEIVAGSAEGDAAIVEGVFGLQKDQYILYYGAIEPKKNVQRLVEAYLSSDTAVPLVIVGKSWGAAAEQRLDGADDPIRGLYGQTLSDRIIRLEYLPRSLLLRLVRGARALAFPSLYEGFGLPVLEAMAMGTPVLTSTTGSIPEIAGEAAILVDPYDIGAIRAGLVQLDRDDELRERLARAGPARAQLFSEDRYRERLAALYSAASAVS